jgi:protein TonB
VAQIRAEHEKPMQKLAATPNQHEPKISQVRPRWKPMGLAPADKPSISGTQSLPKRLDARSYNAKIWSALARKKPKVGQSGSTTVTFAVGQSGALRFVRVSQSSNNPGLDQLALKTVRDAAPLPPPPPFLKDGSAAYTIRIDFH